MFRGTCRASASSNSGDAPRDGGQAHEDLQQVHALAGTYLLETDRRHGNFGGYAPTW